MLAQSKVKSEGFFFFFLWEETYDIYTLISAYKVKVKSFGGVQQHFSVKGSEM
jgi:hypothetical protein